MVNFLHNITALAGAATLVKIFDSKNQLVNLAGNVGIDGVAIFTFPETPGAPNEDWFIIPQATAGTFTIQSVGQPNFFVSYATAATKAIQGDRSQVVASSTLPTVFKMQLVGSGPAVNLIDSTTGSVMTSWINPDPGVWGDPATPLTMEGHNVPPSHVQSFTITLLLWARILDW
ncbi:hypothetical protein B0H19DRAFT_1228038 [Mycena capillaripes]|nr:hypothetical protein B0H19DRAFT_1228038 [Mycena capillaripes]